MDDDLAKWYMECFFTRATRVPVIYPCGSHLDLQHLFRDAAGLVFFLPFVSIPLLSSLIWFT